MLREKKHVTRARLFAWAITAIIAIILVGAGFNWSTVKKFIKDNEEAFKLAGYVVAPAIAYVSFIYGRLDKAELKDSYGQLGYARKAASDAKSEANHAKEDASAAEDRARTAHEAATHARNQSDSAAALATTAAREADEKQTRIEELEKEFEKLSDSTQLWRLGEKNRQRIGFDEFNKWKDDRNGPRIITVGLFKGGVGKTHIAANLAAYASIKHKKRVLLIDLDYQGSLSSLILEAANQDPRGSLVDGLFDTSAGPDMLLQRAIHLEAPATGCKLNDKRGLSNVWLLPADYDLSGTESRLLVDRAVRNTDALDERFRLAHVMLHPDVRRHFDVIIIDTPPRMTLGTVNALVASHALVIPTILDKVSAESIKPFLRQIIDLKDGLELYSLQFAGIIGTMARARKLSEKEVAALNSVTANSIEKLGRTFVCKGHLPKKACITNSDDLGYFTEDKEGSLSTEFYDPIFDELWETIYNSTPPRPNRIKLFDN